MEPLSSQADLDAVAARIADIERGTAGEIVVHVVDRSDDYAFWRLLFGVGVAVVLAEAAAFSVPDWAPYGLEMAVALTAVAVWALGASSVLGRVLPKAALAQAVHRRAQAAFMEDGVYRTRDASGVLIFISRMEHRVEILADAGIHARVGTDGWSRHVQALVSGIRTGRGTQALLDTLDAIGDELKDGFPPRPDDRNELANHVITTSR